MKQRTLRRRMLSPLRGCTDKEVLGAIHNMGHYKLMKLHFAMESCEVSNCDVWMSEMADRFIDEVEALIDRTGNDYAVYQLRR